jgi:hypothetical protein
MPAATLQTEAFVLARRPTAADGWQALTLFAPEHGLLLGMQRVPRKASNSQVQLDLFDEAALALESSNQGRTWFVREARIAKRHVAIGRSYAALQGASLLAGLIARNPVSPESRATVTALLRAGLSAFDESNNPEIVTFKCLYCFARDEGYPVKQEWFPSLPPADRELAAGLLNRPLAEQTVSAEETVRLRRSLEGYLRERTEILLE